MIDEGKMLSEMNDDSFIVVESNPPNYWNENLSEQDNESLSTIVSRTSETKQDKIKNRFSELHKDDKGYFKLKTGHNKQSITGFSTSYVPGATIRNASTGFFESDYLGKPIYKVGCDNEDLFFRVSCSVNGINEPRRLFYDNPEQYERHFKTTISPETRKIWTEKYNIAVLIDENRRNKQNAPEYVTIS